MNAMPSRSLMAGRGADLGFIAVVSAAYLSALSALAYIRPPLTSRAITLLIVAGIAYALIRIWEETCIFDWKDRATYVSRPREGP